MAEILGWISSAILVLTISKQVHRQWKAGTSKGVSSWLFVGQCAASVGFLTYSVLIDNWVFVVTNGMMAIAAVVGFSIVMIHRRREQTAEPGEASGNTALSLPPNGRASL